MNLGIIIILVISAAVVSFVFVNQISEIPPPENKSSEIRKPSTETKIINETRVKELEAIVNTTKIPLNDKETIKEQFLIEEWIPIIARVKSYELLDEVINSLSKNEFKLISRTEFKEAIPTFSGNATKNAIIKLQNNIHVEKIYYDFPTKTTLQDSLPLINVDKVWQIQLNSLNITGQLSNRNITICVIDTGVNYTHPDLGGCLQTNNINTAGCSKVIGGYDYDAFPDDENPMDANGHGTHVAGIAFANGSIKGVAPDAKLVALRATGTTNIKNAIDWCVINRVEYNISTISISQVKTHPNGSEMIFSSVCDEDDTMVEAANNAREYGILVVGASGNNGSISGIGSPACGSNVTSVSATSKLDTIPSTLSNRNNLTDLMAPGVGINSTVLSVNGTYKELSGTSQSAPHVAGVAALMKQANNSLTPAEIENLLKKTGKPIYDSTTGLTFPRVDALKAVLASYNPLVVTDFKVLDQDGFNTTFEFKIFNSRNTTVNDAYWTLATDDGSITLTNKNTQNITLNPYNETFVYAIYNYTASGSFNPRVYANASSLSSNTQDIITVVGAYNLILTNFTIPNSSGTERTFEFFVENNGTVNIDNVYWNMTVAGEPGVNGTIGINLKVNETARIYVRYNYTTGGLHDVTAKVDPTNSITETNETDNEQMIPND